MVPSRLLNAVLFGCHGLAMASLFFTDLSAFVLFPLGIGIVISALCHYACYGRLQSPWFIEQLHCSTEGKWSLRTTAGVTKTARLQSGYLHPYVIILRFALGRFAYRSVVILPDSADADAIRRLRVYLLQSTSND